MNNLKNCNFDVSAVDVQKVNKQPGMHFEIDAEIYD